MSKTPTQQSPPSDFIKGITDQVTFMQHSNFILKVRIFLNFSKISDFV